MKKPSLYNLNPSKDSNPLLGRRRPLMAEINVTPFVDVMLVLLVIFMVTAPLMKQGVDVQLPKEKATVSPITDIPTITLKRNKRIYWNQDEVATVMVLAAKLEDYYHKKKDGGVNFRADKSLDYGFVVKILATIKRSGIQRIGMVTENPEL